MGSQPSDEEIFETPFPSLEEQRSYAGKLVAFDSQGKIRLAAATWDELVAQLTDEMLESLTLLDLPPARVIA